MPDIGLPPPRRRCRSVYGTLNLPQGGRQVLGADLNCSESRRGGPPFHEASGLNKPRWPRRPAPWSKARPTFGARVRRAQLSKGSEIMPRPRTLHRAALSLCREPDRRPRVSVVGAEREEGSEMWLALAVITLAAAIGFNVLALAIQSSVSRGKQETASEGDGGSLTPERAA
jgi:hypothetical protein